MDAVVPPSEPAADAASAESQAYHPALQRLVRAAAHGVGASVAELHVLEGNGTARVFRSARRNDGGPLVGLGPVCAEVCASGTAVRITGACAEQPGTEEATAARAVSAAGVPLFGREGEVLGALCVAAAAERAWGTADLALLEDVAASAAAVLELHHQLVARDRLALQLQRDALHDPLTGLPNRLLFMERLEHAVQRARRRQSGQFTILFLDLDRFKVVNDSLGHQVGDQLLVAIAGRLQSCLRAEDTVARLGGDEFAILLEGASEMADATRVAERIRRELGAPVNLSGYEVFPSASIGIALSASAYGRPEHLLRNADTAMYRAKAAGLGRYELYDRAMHADALARLQMETDLRHAVERAEFDLEYQPIISLASGRITGFEALLRWTHPSHGVVPPARFIPVAEETGVILPIGRWVLDRACRQLRDWQERFSRPEPLTMSVNLSVKQFSQPELLEQIREVLNAAGLDPRVLKLEITESVVVGNVEFASRTLAELKALGVQVLMDDFGTGYSSLSYLHRLPLDALKIDRSFIGEMESDSRSLQLVRTILTLARSVGLEVVAEGVATEGQLRELRALSCEYAQGYFFSPAVDIASAEALLKREQRW